jgi:hypothetical protein
MLVQGRASPQGSRLLKYFRQNGTIGTLRTADSLVSRSEGRDVVRRYRTQLLCLVLCSLVQAGVTTDYITES